MTTYLVQKLARASGGQFGTYCEYESVAEFEAADVADALVSDAVAGRGLWAEDDQAEQCDDGQRLPLYSEDGQAWYLFERA